MISLLPCINPAGDPLSKALGSNIFSECEDLRTGSHRDRWRNVQLETFSDRSPESREEGTGGCSVMGVCVHVCARVCACVWMCWWVRMCVNVCVSCSVRVQSITINTGLHTHKLVRHVHPPPLSAALHVHSAILRRRRHRWL